jgi:hypothetical protein
MSHFHRVFLRRTCWSAVVTLLFFCLFAPAPSRAQDIGQIECARAGDFVYLYSSILTLDIRATLQCGQQVEITGRYDSYFGVRTAKGEVGYILIDSILLLKNTPGAKPALQPTPAPNREKLFYDAPGKSAAPAAKAADQAQLLVLTDSTPVRMKLLKSLSSSDSQVGDEVHFEVLDDIVVDGFLVIAKGAEALGVVNEAEPKKAMGRGGKLSVLIRSVRMANNQDAVLRSGTERKGSSSSAGVVIPVMHGKDITFPAGMEFTGYVNGDTRLKRENFHAAPESADASPSAPASPNPQR